MKNSKGIIYALISSGTFGLIPLFSIPLIADGMGNASILFYRFFFSVLAIGSICLIQRKSFRIPLKQINAIVVLGILYAATAFGLICSYKYIPSGIATTIHFLYPIFVTLIMVALFNEPRSKSLFFATILSIVGVALLCWSDSSAINVIGVVFAVSTIFTYSTYIVGVNKSGVEQIDSLILTFYILLSGAILFGIMATITGHSGIEAIPNTESLIRLILLAILATVISDLTLILAIKYTGSTITSILGSMEPLVAIVVGIFFFSENFTFNTFIGFALVIVSVILVISSKKKRSKTQEINTSKQ